MLSREARNIYFIVFELTKPGIIIFLIGDKHTHYYFDKGIENSNLQYSQRHTMINHCDRRITHLSDTDISFVLFNTSSKFLLYLECYSLSPKRHKKVRKQTKQSKKFISITKMSDTSITVISHAMCVYCHMSKKSWVGINFYFTGNSRSRFLNPIFHFRNSR